MARGWESKAVEQQISDRESETRSSPETQAPRTELEQRAKREGFILARTQTLNSLEKTKDPRYRAILEKALAYLDDQIAALDSIESS